MFNCLYHHFQYIRILGTTKFPTFLDLSKCLIWHFMVNETLRTFYFKEKKNQSKIYVSIKKLMLCFFWMSILFTFELTYNQIWTSQTSKAKMCCKAENFFGCISLEKFGLVIGWFYFIEIVLTATVVFLNVIVGSRYNIGEF